MPNWHLANRPLNWYVSCNSLNKKHPSNWRPFHVLCYRATYILKNSLIMIFFISSEFLQHRMNCQQNVCGNDHTKWTCSSSCANHGIIDCDLTVSSGNLGGRRVYRCCTCRCFPSTARVSLENGESVMMSELQIGDKVQTGKEIHESVKIQVARQIFYCCRYRYFPSTAKVSLEKE